MGALLTAGERDPSRLALGSGSTYMQALGTMREQKMQTVHSGGHGQKVKEEVLELWAAALSEVWGGGEKTAAEAHRDTEIPDKFIRGWMRTNGKRLKSGRPMKLVLADVQRASLIEEKETGIKGVGESERALGKTKTRIRYFIEVRGMKTPSEIARHIKHKGKQISVQAVWKHGQQMGIEWGAEANAAPSAAPKAIEQPAPENATEKGMPTKKEVGQKRETKKAVAAPTPTTAPVPLEKLARVEPAEIYKENTVPADLRRGILDFGEKHVSEERQKGFATLIKALDKLNDIGGALYADGNQKTLGTKSKAVIRETFAQAQEAQTDYEKLHQVLFRRGMQENMGRNGRLVVNFNPPEAGDLALQVYTMFLKDGFS